jgi:hypothetical protein
MKTHRHHRVSTAGVVRAVAVPTTSGPTQPVILSSQRALVRSTTSCAMGLKNSLLPMDCGL